jgi:hypothetical protein
MGAAAVIGGITAGAQIMGAAGAASAKMASAQLNVANQELNIQTAKTQESEQLNKSMSHNMVTASSTGVSLGSGSILAMTSNDFHNYSEDKEMYNTDAVIAKANGQVQIKEAQSSEFATVLGAAGGFAGDVLATSGASASQPNAFEYSETNYQPPAPKTNESY